MTQYRCARNYYACYSLPQVSTSEVMVLRSAIRRFVREFGLLRPGITPCGLRMSTIEAHILSTLLANSQSETATNAKMLSEELCVDKSNVSRACARMEKMGLLINEPCSVDARRKWLRLTPDGRAMAETVESASYKKFAELLAVLPSSSAVEVTSALDCLSEAIKKTR